MSSTSSPGERQPAAGAVPTVAVFAVRALTDQRTISPPCEQAGAPRLDPDRFMSPVSDVRPAGPQLPAAHAPVHAMLQSPQCAGSACRFTQIGAPPAPAHTVPPTPQKARQLPVTQVSPLL